MLFLVLIFLVMAVEALLIEHEETASTFLLVAEIILGIFLVVLVITEVRRYLKQKK